MLLGSIFRILMHVNSLASILPSRLGSHPLVLKLITLRFLIFLPTAKRPSFLRILSACLQVNQHTHVGLRDFIRKSLQPVSFGSGLTSSCKLILSPILLFIFFLFNHCFSMGSFRFTLISPTSTLWVSGFIKPLSPILTGYHCPLPSNILLHVPFCPFTCFRVSLGILPSRRAFCCCRRCAAPGTSAFAIAWLGLALAILRAFPAFFASPSQEILSGHWGG